MAKTTLTDEIASEICSLLEVGNYLETAAQVVGVSIDTVYSWIRKGRAGVEPFASFAQAVTRARATGEVDLLQTAVKGDGKGVSYGPAKAAAHVLAVTRPDKFGTRINLVVREQHSEFVRFLESELKTILGEEQGAEVFEQVADRWLNRQIAEMGAEGEADANDAKTEPTLQ